MVRFALVAVLTPLLLLGRPSPPTPAPAESDWLAQVSASIARSEYEFSSAGEAAFTAPNRAHNLRTICNADGMRLEARLAPTWQLDLSLAAFGREGQVVPLARRGAWLARQHRAEREHAEFALREWLHNDERGVEQGFDLAQRPAGDGELCFELEPGADWQAHVDSDGRSVQLSHAATGGTIRYEGLLAFDATQRSLDAAMSWDGDRLRICVDDDDATYPITVDPLATSPSWSREGSIAAARYGTSVATAGDVNGDGYSDMLVGAPAYDNGGVFSPGKVFLYLGRNIGMNVLPSWTATHGGMGIGNALGARVATAGDINGDGYDDILAFGSAVLENEGAVYLWLGGAPGIGNASGLGAAGTVENADWSARGGVVWMFFGQSFGTAGDVNGDGFDDIVIGAPHRANGHGEEGAAFVFYGSAAGMGVEGSPGTADWRAEADQVGALMGWSVAGAGDVNGDGYSDVIVGAPGRWDSYVWFGSALGMGAIGSPANADWSASIEGSWFGGAVATAGDIDGDGYSDVLIGDYTYSNPAAEEGAAFAWFGGVGGLGAAGSAANYDWHIEGGQVGARLGHALSSAGDVNGDGFADVLVGAPEMTNGEVGEGRALAYAGSPTGLSTTPFWLGEANSADANFGYCVAPLGDVNGDGFADIAVGAPAFTNGQLNEGKTYAYHGSANIVENAAAWQLEGNLNLAQYGVSVASAGDINGDGYGDILIGADHFDGGLAQEGKAFLYVGGAIAPSINPAWTAESNQASAHFAHAVAGAGDVNGDGYDDVLIGAPHYESVATQIDEGAAFLWYGSAAGMGANGTPINADWSDQSEKKLSEFGQTVSGAGDVNGDGLADFAVGAPLMELGHGEEGVVFVYHGDAAGPSDVQASRREGNLIGAHLGAALAGAGDVNGDGFSDLVVGADHFSGGNAEEGRVFVYHGSADGIELGAAWSYDMNEAMAHLGASVDGAGDVNGDGYSDVIVGAPDAETGVADGGKAFLFHGSAGGLSLAPDWQASTTVNAACRLGSSVAGAGDVNADGYGDVLIGVPGRTISGAVRGTAALWLGSSLGLNLGVNGTLSNDDWSVDGPIPAAGENLAFASCVASAGDVTGDGFSDLLIGCPGFGGAAVAEGKAFLHYGGGINGMDRAARQRRGDDSAPLGLLGLADNSFRIALRARSAGGRDRVRLEWEVKPLGVPFDDTGHGFGALWTDSGAPGGPGSAVALDELVAALAYDTVYKWRARVVVDDPLFPHGPWLSPASNGRTEWDFRSGSSVVAAPDLGLPSSLVSLSPARPNPFSTSTILQLRVSVATEVRVTVFDLRGRLVRMLFDGRVDAGTRSFVWDGRDGDGAAAASGVYFVRLLSEGDLELAQNRRVVLVR